MNKNLTMATGAGGGKQKPPANPTPDTSKSKKSK